MATNGAFYLTLPSNSSMSYFPKNTLANYTVKLPQAIELSGDWEVGLVEIIYPHSWHNVPPDDVHIEVFDVGDPRKGKSVEIDYGHYGSPKQLTTAINEAFKKSAKSIQLHFNEVTHRMTFEFEGDHLVSLSGGLASMLGFDSTRIYRSHFERSIEAPRGVEMERGFDNLYVYCDIVEQRIVGDVFTPLLRIVPNTGRDGEVIRRVYDTPHFIPVSRKRFQTVEIDIKDDAGMSVQFERGKVLVTIQLRERNYYP
jgi:hypothetical protein